MASLHQTSSQNQFFRGTHGDAGHAQLVAVDGGDVNDALDGGLQSKVEKLSVSVTNCI
jgi:hypothetical protein